jgi:hypothetical protein
MSAFKVKPNTRPLVDPDKLAAFAAGAESPVQQAAPAKPALDDKRRTPAFSIRLTEWELDRLKRIAETTPDSMHAFCIRAIRKELTQVPDPES